jgi:GNAT superfamily N-acetyltransferase
MAITIRTASHAEAGLVADLVADLLTELSGGEEVDREEIRATTAELMSDGVVTALLARDGREVVGALMLNECAAVHAGGRFGEISELYVRPDRRSQGIASQLLAVARRIAGAREWKRLEVGAPDPRAWARTKAFYEREGFTEVGPRLKRPI